MLTLLFALMAIAFIYFSMLAPPAPAADTQPGLNIHQAAPVGLAGACRGNRQELRRSILTWSVTHPGQTPTMDSLRASGFEVPKCPAGGEYSLEDEKIRCSVHSE